VELPLRVLNYLVRIKHHKVRLLLNNIAFRMFLILNL
jgi:hypothetical protein